MEKKKKNNGGYLMENKSKTSEKSPDWKGKVNFEGKEFFISGWRQVRDGAEMISLSLTDPATLPPPIPNDKSNDNNFNKSSIPTKSQSQVPTAPSPYQQDYSDLDELESLFGKDFE